MPEMYKIVHIVHNNKQSSNVNNHRKPYIFAGLNLQSVLSQTLDLSCHYNFNKSMCQAGISKQPQTTAYKKLHQFNPRQTITGTQCGVISI